MSWRQRLVILVLSAAAAALLIALPRLALPYPPVPAWDGPAQFSPDRAWADVVTLATRFPRRWSGGPDRKAAADWIATRLAEAGLEVGRATFPVWLGARQPVVLENVWGISRGTERPDEIVVAMGNYDMAPTSVQAASDTAGHAGTVLELARLFAAMPHRRTFIFFFPDGEEWGMLGAREFAQTFPDRAKIVAALSIEDLDVGNLRALGIDGIGQFRGFAPMWLRVLAADATSREGYPVEEVGALFEWLQRSVLVSFTDQGPLLDAGIPAVDLAGRGDNPVLQHQVYHLPGDTIEKMRPGAVGAYGRIQERILRGIDVLPHPPGESDYYLQVAPNRVVRFPWLALAQVGVFLPLVASVIFRMRRADLARAGLAREGLAAATIVAVMLLGLVVLRVLPITGLLPRYALYPPPPRHPLLTEVQWLPVILVAGVIIVGSWAAARLLRRQAGAIKTDEPIAAALFWLLPIALLGLADNPFGAVTFLLLPALLWVWIEPRPSWSGRVGNAALIGLGFLVLVGLFAQYAAILEIGPYILWYVFMGLAYGQFSLLRTVLAFATVAVALRLLAGTVLNIPIKLERH